MLAVFFLLVGITATVRADSCSCVNVVQKINATAWPNLVFVNPTSDGTYSGASCDKDCTFYGSSANPSRNGLYISIVSSDGMGLATLNLLDGGSLVGPLTTDKYWSTTPNISVQYTSKGATPKFLIIATEADGFRPAPTSLPSTPSQSTPPYDPAFNINPSLISNEILLAFDTSAFKAEFSTLQTLAHAFVDKLNIVNDINVDTGSRVTLIRATQFEGFSQPVEPYWTPTKDVLITDIDTTVNFGTDHSYYNSFNGILSAAFANDKVRPHAPHYFVLFTSRSPKDAQGLQFDFEKYDVHPILVQYNMSTDDSNFYSDIWDKFNATGNVNADVLNLINNYFLTANHASCQWAKPDDSIELDPTNATAEVYFPANYNGPKSGDTWSDDHFRYCNFQSSSFVIKTKGQPTTAAPTTKKCVTVYYELENERDFVRVYENGQPHPTISFTGEDISGAQFSVIGDIKFEFSSDNKNAYRGFYASVKNCI